MTDYVKRDAVLDAIPKIWWHYGDTKEAMNVVNALPAIAPAVKVKPLVWSRFGRECVRAESPFGLYDVMWGFGVELAYLTHCGKMWKHYTIEAAKAAAQANYEQRILAALDVTPIDPAQIRADALREAAAAIAALPTGKTEDVCEGHEQAYRVVLALIDQPAPDPVANAARVIRQHGAEATATAMILHIAETLQAKGKAVLTTDHGDFGQQVLEYARAIAEGQP